MGAQQSFASKLKFPPGEKGKAMRSFSDQVSSTNLQITRLLSAMSGQRQVSPRAGSNTARSTLVHTQEAQGKPAPLPLFSSLIFLGPDPKIPPNQHEDSQKHINESSSVQGPTAPSAAADTHRKLIFLPK